jgi:hypothetical protein
MANAQEYFVNKLSRMHISIVQDSKFFSTIVGDMVIL